MGNTAASAEWILALNDQDHLPGGLLVRIFSTMTSASLTPYNCLTNILSFVMVAVQSVCIH